MPEDSELMEQEAMVAHALQEIGLMDNQEAEQTDNDEYDEDDVREILMSQYERVRKEIRDKRNARGFKKPGAAGTAANASTSGARSKIESFRVDIQALKAKTSCKNCKEVGH